MRRDRYCCEEVVLLAVAAGLGSEASNAVARDRFHSSPEGAEMQSDFVVGLPVVAARNIVAVAADAARIVRCTAGLGLLGSPAADVRSRPSKLCLAVAEAEGPACCIARLTFGLGRYFVRVVRRW